MKPIKITELRKWMSDNEKDIPSEVFHIIMGQLQSIAKDDELRVCENCKYPNKNNYCKIIDNCVDKDFGCNKFEEK